MKNLKQIWDSTFLGKLISSDPWMGRLCILVIGIYTCIHIFRLEVYPLYLFAMYSKKEVPTENYKNYKIYNHDQEIYFEDWDYRKYTVLMNTISQYDGILNNILVHPEAHVIDKFMDRLNINNSGFRAEVKDVYKYSKEDLKAKLGAWVSHELSIEQKDLIILRNEYNWGGQSPALLDKTLIHGLD